MTTIQKYPGSVSLLGRGEDLLSDPNGYQKLSLPVSSLNSVFTYDISPSAWFMYENGLQVYTSSSITSAVGCAKLLTTDIKTTLLLESRECPKHQCSRGNLISLSCRLPNKLADGVRDFGMFLPENGIFFRLRSDGKLYAVVRGAGVEIVDEEIDTSSISGFDVEKNNAYYISTAQQASGIYSFYICDPVTQYPKRVHTINLIGTLASPGVSNPALPAAFKVSRLTQDVELNLAYVDISIDNGYLPSRSYTSNYSLAVVVNGTDVPLLVTRSPLTIGGVTNTRDAVSIRFNLFCTKKATFNFWGTRDSTGITGATYAAFGGGSYLETDSPDKNITAVRATAVTTSKLRRGLTVTLEAGVETSRETPYQTSLTLKLQRGDYSLITCTSTTAEASASLEYAESLS